MARHRIVGFNAIRANPKICGFNLTGMLDHAFTGEGVWRFWRDWKPGAFDAMQDGWAPVRWCLFVEPKHTYVGRPIKIEAVLANEDAVRPGGYSGQFQLWGPKGSVWRSTKPFTVVGGPNASLAIPVLKEQVTVSTAGSYEFVPYVPSGIAPPETSPLRFSLNERHVEKLFDNIAFVEHLADIVGVKVAVAARGDQRVLRRRLVGQKRRHAAERESDHQQHAEDGHQHALILTEDVKRRCHESIPSLFASSSVVSCVGNRHTTLSIFELSAEHQFQNAVPMPFPAALVLGEGIERVRVLRVAL